jgi:hypothetical protein
MITVITGSLASGKTYWIREQITKSTLPVIYFSPHTESFPIDRIYLQSEFPHLSFLSVGEEYKLQDLSNQNAIYIEIPWYLDLESSEPFLKLLNCHRVAIVAIDDQIEKWTVAVDEIVFSQVENRIKMDEWLNNPKNQCHQGNLKGEILDFASLVTFWSELTQGAYGEVIRVKGIFDILDGQSIYGEFLKGFEREAFETLNLPLHLEGRPNRFSGIEIIGRNLDRSAIAATLGDCCLTDEAITYYQQQVKATLALEMEED